MAQTKKVDKSRWSEFLRMFSNGNRRRKIAIEVADLSTGDQPLTDAVPLFAIDYDPENKGDDLRKLFTVSRASMSELPRM